jgi:peptidyl-prolyl cis-trans isomerase B (cyclophilin B)
MNAKLSRSIIVLFLSATFCQAQTTFTYTGKPRFQILTKRANVVLGAINVELFPNIAPYHVRNFDSLVSVGFYDTTAFHRAIPNFMIQGGDPNSRSGPISTWGFGDPSQPTVDAEFSAAKHVRGTLSAARSSNINSATSQFFICVTNTPWLNNLYSVYGRVTSGMNFADTIALSPKMTTYTNTPLQKVEMYITYIGSNDTVPKAPILSQPVSGLAEVDTLFNINLQWNAVSDAIIYTLEVATDSLFTNIIKSEDVASTSYSLPNLVGYTQYFWRVRTNNGGHFSPYSTVWNFRTLGEFVSISKYSNATNQLVVYPNPSQGKFTFNALEKGDQLEIYDNRGRLTYKNNASDKSLTIELEGKDKGIYTYKIYTVKKETIIGKLIIR